jgi:RES domain-containing protein
MESKIDPSPQHTLWRISNYHSLGGEGGLFYPGRWHTLGHPVVYLAESPAGAMLETLVHMELRAIELPPTYNLLQVIVAESVPIESLKVSSTSPWKSDSSLTRSIGDEWLESRRSALARVPSAILPNTWNCLLNSNHPDARLVQIADSTIAHFDPRLLRKIRP